MPPKSKIIRKSPKNLTHNSDSDSEQQDEIDDIGPYINMNLESEPVSLDIDDTSEQKHVPMFYFCVDDIKQNGKTIFSIKQSTIKKLIPFFNTILLCDTPPDTEENAVRVEQITVNDDCAINSVYTINTIQQYKTIIEYVTYWETRLDTENYINPNKQQSGYIHQILGKIDLDIIDRYVDEQLQGKKFLTNATKKYARISAINPLLKCVDGFLQMKGFSNKLYSYVAEIIRTCSIVDMSDNYLAKQFESLQLEAFEQWRNDNPELLHDGIETTGGAK